MTAFPQKRLTAMSDYLVDKLAKTSELTAEEYLSLIENRNEYRDSITKAADKKRREYYGNKIFIRGLIEFSNICKNDCFYCGIRKSNKSANRYRLTPAQILDCCEKGYALGFRTFVLQGGEDGHFTDENLVPIVQGIKKAHPDCAVTLSVGERSFESYKALRQAGADRYLLRHETATQSHYEKLHPKEMSFDNRMRCLADLKSLGYQTGAGFMVGSPYQTNEDIVRDILFLKKLKPEMVGIGPFIPHKDTPFANFGAGSAELTCFLLSVIRLTLPNVLLPATTALATVDPRGREMGIEAGANVLMPNLSPSAVTKDYTLYDNKVCTGDETAQEIEKMRLRMERIGYSIVTERGDCKGIKDKEK